MPMYLSGASRKGVCIWCHHELQEQTIAPGEGNAESGDQSISNYWQNLSSCPITVCPNAVHYCIHFYRQVRHMHLKMAIK